MALSLADLWPWLTLDQYLFLEAGLALWRLDQEWAVDLAEHGPAP